MSDLLHTHLSLGEVEDCPACEQLERDFCWIRASDTENGLLPV